MYGNKRVIVLDLETQKSFAEIDRSKLYQLKISVVGIYDSAEDRYLSFEEKELPRLEEYLKAADLLVGFNIVEFDLKVLGPYLLMDTGRLRVMDIMQEFQKLRGHRVSLQSLAQATLKDSKSGTGWDALQLFKDGRMEDLKRYCLDDVRITKAIFDYGLKHKKIIYFSNREMTTHEVEVDWSGFLKDEAPQEKSFPSSLF